MTLGDQRPVGAGARVAADLYATAGPPQGAGAALEWVIWADVRRGTVTEVWGHRLAGQRLDEL